MYAVIDDFLPTEIYNIIKHCITHVGFPWFYQPESVEGAGDAPFFSHNLFQEGNVHSDWFANIEPVLQGLEAGTLLNLRFNMVVPVYDKTTDWHRDTYTDDLSHITAILYFGENNGPTLISDGGEVAEVFPKDNRLLVFDADTPHCLRIQTDAPRRIVLNMNYFPTDKDDYIKRLSCNNL